MARYHCGQLRRRGGRDVAGRWCGVGGLTSRSQRWFAAGGLLPRRTHAGAVGHGDVGGASAVSPADGAAGAAAAVPAGWTGLWAALVRHAALECWRGCIAGEWPAAVAAPLPRWRPVALAVSDLADGGRHRGCAAVVICRSAGVAHGCTLWIRLLAAARADADARHDDGWHVRRLIVALVVACATAAAHADGGRLQMRQAAGPFVVSLFTTPESPAVGPADLSVMVEEQGSGSVLLDADVSVTLTSGDDRIAPVIAHLSHAHATNRLLEDAIVQLPRAGRWHAVIHVTQAGGEAR